MPEPARNCLCPRTGLYPTESGHAPSCDTAYEAHLRTLEAQR